MKRIANLCIRLTLIIGATITGHHAGGAVNVALTPSTTSNTYSGILNLNVTGLTNTETVTVQKYLVADGGNVVDSSAFLIQQFQLTDGAASVFTNGSTSVTNFNVPGDMDGAANGSITANLYPGMDFDQIYIGNYLFVVSSPVGHFSPFTNSFTVTNFPFAQTITGNVISNNITSATLPYSVVVLLVGQGGNNSEPVAGVVAGANGAYSIDVPPGTYSLIAFHPNYVTPFSGAPSVTVNPGATVTNNVSLIYGTNTISGKLEDANSGAGLGGTTLQIQADDRSVFAFGFGDTNGNFSASVTPYQWKLKPDDRALVWKGYDQFSSGLEVDTTTGSVSGLVVTAPKATAIFYGKVTDSSGNPLPGAAIESDDYNGAYDYFDGLTFTNGHYVTAAVGGVSGDQWEVGYDYGGPANYIYSQSTSQMSGVTLNIGQAVRQDFIGILGTNYISGNIQFNGTNVVGVGVSASATIGGQNFNISVDTDTNGNYSLSVVNTNTWNVSLNCNGGSDSLDNILGSGAYDCPNNQNVFINGSNETVNFIIQPSGGNPDQIYGSVTDGDGDPVVGVDVYADDGMGDIYTNQTDGSGDYAMNVPDGNYSVSVDCTQLGNLGYGCPGEQYIGLFGSSDEVDFIVPSCGSLGVTTTSLPDGMVGANYNVQLQYSGCNPPFTWSLENGSGPLPGGLTLSDSGAISGTPTNGAYFGITNYFFVQVTDGDNNTADQLLSIVVYPTLTLSPGPLPKGTNGIPYSAQLLVSGGRQNYYGNTPEGYTGTGTGSFPPGLNFSYGAITVSNAYFVFSGTPTSTGTYLFSGEAQDADGNVVSNNYSITIVAATAPLQINTTSLTNGTVGAAYTNQLQAGGGATPYTWTLAQGSQPLPPGLTLSTYGIIGGIPLTNGTSSFIVRVTDANLLTTTRSLTLVVIGRPVLQKPVWVNHQFSAWIEGATGQNYTVQMSTNVVSTNWSTVLITNNLTTNSFPVLDPNATNKQRYYRLLLGP